MKILVNQVQPDFRMQFLTNTATALGFTVGTITTKVEEDIRKFDPDVVIHNDPEENEFPCVGKKCITIAINNGDAKCCYSFTDEDHPGYIKPFVNIQNPGSFDERYSSDIAYIGNPSSFLAILPKIPFDVRVYNDQPLQFSQYFGSISFDEYRKVYASIKACILEPGNKYQLLDIIFSDGTPVFFYNDDQLLSDLKDVMGGKKVDYDLVSKSDIVKNDTNFDRLSEILKKQGLNIQAFIMNEKRKLL